jgi:hypothetical protein
MQPMGIFLTLLATLIYLQGRGCNKRAFSHLAKDAVQGHFR